PRRGAPDRGDPPRGGHGRIARLGAHLRPRPPARPRQLPGPRLRDFPRGAAGGGPPRPRPRALARRPPPAAGARRPPAPRGVRRYGRMRWVKGPGSRSGAARLANSQSSGRVSRGSTISSIQNVSAERNGERSFWRRSSISASLAAGSAAASISAREAASIPPPSRSEPPPPARHAPPNAAPPA